MGKTSYPGLHLTMTCDHHHRTATNCLGQSLTVGRRDFVRLALLGGGAALFMSAAPLRARASGKAKALVLSCMDYRLVDDTARFMDDKGFRNEYDHVILAGASLGVVSDKFKDWHDTFWQHLNVAIELHHIEKVIVIDHRDCGAYRLALGEAAVATPELETAVHTKIITDFAGQVKTRHSELGVFAFLMALDGTVQGIPV